MSTLSVFRYMFGFALLGVALSGVSNAQDLPAAESGELASAGSADTKTLWNRLFQEASDAADPDVSRDEMDEFLDNLEKEGDLDKTKRAELEEWFRQADIDKNDKVTRQEYDGFAKEKRHERIWDIVLIVAAFVLVAFLVVVAVVFAKYARLWVQSFTTGAGIGIFDLLGMTFRKVKADVIVRSKIMAVQAGLTEKEYGITSKALEGHYLAGGNVPLVIRAMIAAHKAKMTELDFKLARAIDLAGRNVLEAVQTSVYPKVIDCPSRTSGRQSLDGVAQNGIQLKVRVRVTVRANLVQLIGGATEETIIARVGEGIVSAIGSAKTHGEVLENPDRISKTVLERRLDAQTAFEIVSIDIADIDVGENIGARLQADQAEADVRVARANAEGRRAMAVATGQEYIAEIEENRAKVVEAEAEVPKAIAQAFREGKLGIMDYYKLRNVQADTDMRTSIAKAGPAARRGG